MKLPPSKLKSDWLNGEVVGDNKIWYSNMLAIMIKQLKDKTTISKVLSKMIYQATYFRLDLYFQYPDIMISSNATTNTSNNNNTTNNNLSILENLLVIA